MLPSAQMSANLRGEVVPQTGVILDRRRTFCEYVTVWAETTRARKSRHLTAELILFILNNPDQQTIIPISRRRDMERILYERGRTPKLPKNFYYEAARASRITRSNVPGPTFLKRRFRLSETATDIVG